MIKCNATGRHCLVMTVILGNPVQKGTRGVVLTDDKSIVYRIKLTKEPSNNRAIVEYVMPYCPWCGARLRAGRVVT